VVSSEPSVDARTQAPSCFLQKHNIPVSAIPCLQYRRALEKDKELGKEKELEEDKDTVSSEQQVASNSG
jgi:hypothetical protein